MAETKRSFLDRMEKSLVEVAPRIEAAGAAEQAAKYQVAMERLHAARRAAALVSDDELRAVRLAVERVRADVGRLAV